MPAAFAPFSATHAVVLLAIAAGATGLVVARRRRPGAVGRRLDRALGALNLLAWLLASAWVLMPARLDWSRSLPMQVCDLSALAAAVAMTLGHRAARALLYYAGIGLSGWALWTPDLRDGPGTPEFWLFFVGHGATLSAAVYDIAARGYRPGWRDCRLAVAGMLVWLAVVFPLNAAYGWNYGYTGNALAGTTNPIHFLGPWPWRVLWLALGVIGLFVVMTLPFRLTRDRR